MAGCERRWFDQVSAWHDGEVTAVEARRIEAHLDGCEACRAAAGALANMRAALVRTASHEVPTRLAARVAAAAAPSRRRTRALVSAAAVAALVVGSIAAWPRGLGSDLADEAITHHLGGFARERPCDFESSDPAAVAAWVEERLVYHVSVPTPHDARLVGARVCNLGGEKTAALMYRADDAPMTIFVPPATSKVASAVASYAGRDVRCERGALSNQLCATASTQPMLAVSAADTGALAASFEVLR